MFKDTPMVVEATGTPTSALTSFRLGPEGLRLYAPITLDISPAADVALDELGLSFNGTRRLHTPHTVGAAGLRVVRRSIGYLPVPAKGPTIQTLDVEPLDWQATLSSLSALINAAENAGFSVFAVGPLQDAYLKAQQCLAASNPSLLTPSTTEIEQKACQGVSDALAQVTPDAIGDLENASQLRGTSVEAFGYPRQRSACGKHPVSRSRNTLEALELAYSHVYRRLS